MSIAAFFGSVKSAQRERLDAKVITFDSLVLQVANDESLDPDEVADQLDQLGRTAEELATAAQLIVDRRGWTALVPKDAELLAEHNRLVGEQESATTQHVAAVRLANAKHAQQVGAIQQRLAAIVIERDRSQTARNKLFHTAPERQRLAKLHDEHAEAVRALEGPLHIAMRAAKNADVGFYQGEIQRTQVLANQLTVEIAKLEREALRP